MEHTIKYSVGTLLLLFGGTDCLAQTWPLNSATRSAAKTFGDFDGNKDWDFHEGVDFPAADNTDVRAMKAGDLTIVQQPPNGIAKIENNGINLWYVHLSVVSVADGATVAEGAVIGKTGDYHAQYPDHLHLTQVTGNVFTPETTLNPLQLFAAAGDKDPGGTRPTISDRLNPTDPWDADDDAFEFHEEGGAIFPKANGVWRVKGEVDGWIEIQDNMNELIFFPAAYKTGYWIKRQTVKGGHDVKTSAAPYVLFEFDSAPYSGATSLVSKIFPGDKMLTVLAGRELNFHHVVTNTKGVNGAPGNVDSDQHWYSKANGAGMNGGNGVGAAEAMKASEAYFPDGTYTFGAKAWDLIGASTGFTDPGIDIYSENYAPAVTETQPMDDESEVPLDQIIRIQFSEPMNQGSVEAAIVFKKVNGPNVAYTVAWLSEWEIQLTPITILFPGTNYELRVLASTAKDLYGNDATMDGALLDGDYWDANHDGIATGTAADDALTMFTTGDGFGGCDGLMVAAPCGNISGFGDGCMNSTGQGGRLTSLGSSSVALDDLNFLAENLVPFQAALLFTGPGAINNGFGVPFGDGLRCVGGNVKRLGVRFINSAGVGQWGPGLQPQGGWLAGTVGLFQVWYRDPMGPCGSAFNLTNGVGRCFEP